MRHSLLLTSVLTLSICPALAADDGAPNAPFPGAAPRGQIAPLDNAQLTNQTRRALAFYGGYSARSTLSQLPRRSSIRSASPQAVGHQLKPFNTFEAEPTLSPYLLLDREETAEDVPNYLTFVRPQFQQFDTNRAQQREIQNLRRRLNTVSSTVVTPQHGPTSTPGTSAPARFMDTAQFYGGWRR